MHCKQETLHLGFFVSNEDRIPVNFHEILASIAPRPVLVIAPTLDKDANLEDVQYCVNQVKKVYRLYDSKNNLEIYSPVDYNRFNYQMREKVYEWAGDRLNE
ncbi:hypothetical protein ACFLSA_06200 [Bacteroidota bacterium]